MQCPQIQTCLQCMFQALHNTMQHVATPIFFPRGRHLPTLLAVSCTDLLVLLTFPSEKEQVNIINWHFQTHVQCTCTHYKYMYMYTAQVHVHCITTRTNKYMKCICVLISSWTYMQANIHAYVAMTHKHMYIVLYIVVHTHRYNTKQ